MNDPCLLRIDGEVQSPRQLTFADLVALDQGDQIRDVSHLDPRRQGEAVKLEGLLKLVGASPTARYLGLHSATDDFHASIPLAPVRRRAVLIYAHQGQPLPVQAGGPLRFYIPDHAACHTDEIDECANVKFVDHLELTVEKGRDNRPEDDAEHEKLHQQ